MAIISNYIDIAPNEYFTKYSFNRNFNKLISNDIELNSYLNVNNTNSEEDKLKKAQSYNKNKVYSEGEFVFYKIQKYDTKFYILKSKKNNNTHKPGVKQNEKTGEMYVVNTDYWTILGISENSGNARQKDKADVYINEKIYDFVNDHEQNTTLTAHPTGKLGLRDSSKTFLTLENISEDRQKLFYPNTIQSFITDNTTYSGYMRKWDNGLLEYDIVFRLSYISSDEFGRSLLSANNLVVPHSNKNFMYFKEDSDYEIFNQGGTGYVVTDTSKQVNLNPTMNAYSGKINFIEPFKDLNYMVFTSNNKVIEIESHDLNHEVLSGYDSRLVINNRSIVGLKDGSIFKTPCNIPNKVINIADNAIEYAQKVGTEPVIFNIDPYQSQLVNIGDFAFNMSDIDHVVIPQSVKYIGQKAFNTCGYLTDVSIYLSDQVDLSSQQLYIGYKAFPSQVSSITIIYPPSEERSISSQNDLYSALLNDMSYRTNIGLNGDLDKISIKSINRTDSVAIALAAKIEHANDFLPTTRTIALAAKSELENEIDQSEENSIISVSVEDFIAHLQEMKNEKPLLKSSPKRTLLKAIRPAFDPINDINSLILMNSHQITGYANNFVFENIELNLSNLSTIPHRINSNSLNNFSYLTSLTSNIELTGIQQNGLNFRTLKNLEIHLSTLNYDFNFSNSNIDTLTFIFEKQPTSLSVNLLNSNIQNFNLYGKNSSLQIINSMISASNINNFVVSGFSSYEISAFTHISSINNATLYSSNTFVHTKIFGIDDEGDYVVDNLTLKNGSWTFGQNAFYGIRTNYLSIDMTNFQVNQGGYSFQNGTIGQLELINSTPQLYSNLQDSALCSDYIGYAIIPDQNFNTIAKQNISFFNNLSTNNIQIGTSTLTAEPNTFFCTHNSWNKIKSNEYYQISSINDATNYQIYKIDVTTGTDSLVKSIISSVTMLSDSYNNALSIYGYNSTQITGNANIKYIDATYSATRSKMYKIQSPGTKLWNATKLLKLGFHDKTMIRFKNTYKFLSANASLTEAVFINAPSYFIKNPNQTTQISSINWDQWKATNSNVITIPYGMTSIANNAFSTNNSNYISAVQQIIIPESISSIGNSAFEGLLSTEIVMFEPDISLSSIGNNAFNNCKSLDSIKIIK